MRPRKTILLVNVNGPELGMQRYMLDMHGYRVVTAQDAAAALAEHALGVDLVLGFADGMLRAWARLAEQMKAAHPEVVILLLARLKPEMRASIAPAAEMVLDGRTSTAELLERVRCLIARKRGPRKPVPVLALAGD